MKKSSKTIIRVYALIIIILFSAVLSSLIFDIPFSHLTRDTAATGNLPLYTGWISYLGAIFWCAAASIAIFTAYLTRSKNKKFFIQIGILSLILLIDDLFMIHEGLLELINVSELVLYGLYGLFILFILKDNYHYIKKNHCILLLVALALLSMSVLIDILPESILPYHYLFEDGSKFLGIGGWAIYIILVSKEELRARLPSKRSS